MKKILYDFITKFSGKLDWFIVVGALVFGSIATRPIWINNVHREVQAFFPDKIIKLLVSLAELPFTIPVVWYIGAMILVPIMSCIPVSKLVKSNRTWNREDCINNFFSSLLILITRYWMFYFAIKLVLDEKVPNVNLIDCIANIRQVFSVKIPLELFNPFLFWFNAIVWLFYVIICLGQQRSGI